MESKIKSFLRLQNHPVAIRQADAVPEEAIRFQPGKWGCVIAMLNAAAKGMKMAYSKAWRIIKETEAALGMQLLDRDGAHGSTLTEEGNKLLDTYLEIDAKLQKVAEDEFAKRFK